jgi:hypothetical protein
VRSCYPLVSIKSSFYFLSKLISSNALSRDFRIPEELLLDIVGISLGPPLAKGFKLLALRLPLFVLILLVVLSRPAPIFVAVVMIVGGMITVAATGGVIAADEAVAAVVASE